MNYPSTRAKKGRLYYKTRITDNKKARNPKRATCLIFFGGADRDRTDDLLNAIQALSQLSYSPTEVFKIKNYYTRIDCFVKRKKEHRRGCFCLRIDKTERLCYL